MADTVVSLFADPLEAEQALEDLRSAGVEEQSISVIANRDACEMPRGRPQSGGSFVGKGVLVGAAAGGAGLAALAIPGIGPVIAFGPLAAAIFGAGLGGVAGGIVAELKLMGVTEDDAGCLCEAIKRGGTVLTVVGDEQQTAKARQVLGRHRLVDLDECRGKWSQAGWKSFDGGDRVSEPEELAESRRPGALRSYERAGRHD